MARRRYQRGSLFLRGKNPKWIGRFLEDVQEQTGIRRVQRTVVLGDRIQFPTKRLAARELERRLHDINHSIYQPVKVASFEQFVAQWSSAILPQYKFSTQADVRSQLNKYCVPAFGRLGVRDVSCQLVQEFLTGLSASLSPKRIKNIYVTLRLLFKSARAWGYTTANPLEGIVLPRRVLTTRPCFTLEEIRRILAATQGPLKTFLWLAAETGMRAGELAGLRTEDVDLKENLVQVRQNVWRGHTQSPKSARGARSFRVSLALQRLLAEHLLGLQPEPRYAGMRFLFATRSGRPWDPGLVVKRKLYPLLDRLQIARKGLHAFRHGNATLLDRLGAPVKLRQDRLGHANSDTTLGIYTHVASEDEARITRELGAMLEAA